MDGAEGEVLRRFDHLPRRIGDEVHRTEVIAEEEPQALGQARGFRELSKSELTDQRQSKLVSIFLHDEGLTGRLVS